MIHQGNIAALQQAISRTLSETYEVDTALDLWMLKLLKQLEEDEERGIFELCDRDQRGPQPEPEPDEDAPLQRDKGE